MPPNKHLQWAEIRDFAPGLWTNGEWLMPPSAGQEMTDCYPQPGGGLRAFYEPTAMDTTGIGSTSTEKVIGLWAHTGVPHRSLSTDSSDYYLMTYDKAGTNLARLYRWDQTDIAETDWRLIKTFALGGGAPHEVQWTSYILSAGTRYMVFSLFVGSADDGLWKVKYSDGAVSAFTGGKAGVLAQHQSRIINSGVSGSGSVVYFTQPGSLTFDASGYVDIEPARPNSLNVMLMPYAPSDLFVGKAGAGFHMVQGDITDPIVRSMSAAQFQGVRQTPCYTPAGTTFLEPDNGVWATGSGSEFTRLDTQLGADGGPSDAPADYCTNDIGQLAYMHHWLMAPRGFVYDFRTKSWFKTSPLSSPTPGFHYFVDTLNNILLAPSYNPDGSFVINRYVLTEGEGGRFNTFAWTSATVRDPGGRQLEIREVQAYVKAHDSSSQVAVTVGGTTRTITGLAAGLHQLSFLFSSRGETQDVRVVPTAGSAANEAPSLEVVRIGFRGTHLLQHG